MPPCLAYLFLKFISLCAHPCMWGWDACNGVCTKARGQPLVSEMFSAVWSNASHPVEVPGFSCLCLLSYCRNTRMTVTDYCPQFHLGCRDLNSGPHVCTTWALPTELSFPQAQASIFFANASGPYKSACGAGNWRRCELVAMHWRGPSLNSCSSHY